MLVRHDETVPSARLLTFLEHDERLANACAKAQAALALTDQMLLTVVDLFEVIGEDPTAWAQDVRKFLPEWLVETSVTP